MTTRQLLATTTALAALLAAPALGADRGWEPGVLVGTLPEPVTETSGLTAGGRGDGVLWTHNDSSDLPFDPTNAQVFATTTTGELVATVAMQGVGVTDVEDIAWGPGPDGSTPSLYVADIGDNFTIRPQVIVYVLPEPALDPTERDGSLSIAPTSTYTLTYPGPRHDAETLLVHPITGQLTIVTKTTSGVSRLFTAPRPTTAVAAAVLTETGEVDFGAIFVRDSYNDAFPDNELQATGGEISPDGTRVVIRTYTEGHDWALPPDGDVAAAVQEPPTNVAIPDESQGEAIAWGPDGTDLFTSSENTRTLHRMALSTPSTSIPPTPTPPAAQPLPVTGGGLSVLALAALPLLAARRRGPHGRARPA